MRDVFCTPNSPGTLLHTCQPHAMRREIARFVPRAEGVVLLVCNLYPPAHVLTPLEAPIAVPRAVSAITESESLPVPPLLVSQHLGGALAARSHRPREGHWSRR